MTIIDQRILIPAGPEVVWEQISDISNNPKWQADCRSISFLTSLRDGQGMRWRSTNADGRETVLEITTWYDRIGYEYTYIDGAPFRESKGRLRLQEIAEGTIVQWTFTYEISGVLGGLRNSLSLKRQIENTMIDSLKSLWRHVNQSGGSQPFHEAKSLMRNALDYEERSKYRPRHPSALGERGKMPEEEIDSIFEPPIADDDTRPRPALAVEAYDQPAPEPVINETDFQPKEPHADEAWMPKPEPIAEKPRDTQERKQVEPASEFAPPVATDTQPNAPIIDDAPKPPPTPADVDRIQPLKDISKLDTAQISIWEVFGVPRPSETQEIQPIKIETVSTPKSDEVEKIVPEPIIEAVPTPEIDDLEQELEKLDEPVVIAAEPSTIAAEPSIIAAEPIIVAESASPILLPAIPKPAIDMPQTGLRIVMRRKLVKLRRTH